MGSNPVWCTRKIKGLAIQLGLLFLGCANSVPNPRHNPKHSPPAKKKMTTALLYIRKESAVTSHSDLLNAPPSKPPPKNDHGSSVYKKSTAITVHNICHI